jgi:hypothetical protein
MYPVSYEADAAIDGRNRLTTFFRYFVAIPWVIVAALYSIGASIAVIIAWFAIVFTGRYPEGLYNFNAGFLRMISRVNGFHYLLTDDFPPFNGEEDPAYPVRVGIAPPLDKYSRLKTFFRGIVGIPVLILGWIQGLILGVVTLIAWFAILFTGKFPEGLFGPARSASAYMTRYGAYFMLMTEDWPPFSLEDDAGAPAGELTGSAASRQA